MLLKELLNVLSGVCDVIIQRKTSEDKTARIAIFGKDNNIDCQTFRLIESNPEVESCEIIGDSNCRTRALITLK